MRNTYVNIMTSPKKAEIPSVSFITKNKIFIFIFTLAQRNQWIFHNPKTETFQLINKKTSGNLCVTQNLSGKRTSSKCLTYRILSQKVHFRWLRRFLASLKWVEVMSSNQSINVTFDQLRRESDNRGVQCRCPGHVLSVYRRGHHTGSQV